MNGFFYALIVCIASIFVGLYYRVNTGFYLFGMAFAIGTILFYLLYPHWLQTIYDINIL